MFTLVSLGLLGGPGVAGASTAPSDAVTVQETSQVDLSEIPEGATEALSCYGGGHSFGRGSNTNYVPGGYPNGPWFTTRGNCNDINLILDTSPRQIVRICFNPRSGNPYCQTSTTTLVQGQWTVVATGVAPGTQFKINFYSVGQATGRVAT